jgi:hypothetical protein
VNSAVSTIAGVTTITVDPIITGSAIGLGLTNTLIKHIITYAIVTSTTYR